MGPATPATAQSKDKDNSDHLQSDIRHSLSEFAQQILAQNDSDLLSTTNSDPIFGSQAILEANGSPLSSTAAQQSEPLIQIAFVGSTETSFVASTISTLPPSNLTAEESNSIMAGITNDILPCNKLTSTNWLNWRYRMRAILKLKKLLSVVDTEPTPAVKAGDKYDDENTRARLYITQYLPDDILSTVQHLEDSYHIWKALQTLHEGSGAGKIARLFESLFHLGDAYSTATYHIGCMRQLAGDIDAADKLDGKIVARYFVIKTLPRQFDPLIPVLMNMHDKSFDAVCELIIDYERSNFQNVLAAQTKQNSQWNQHKSNPGKPSSNNNQPGPNRKRPQFTYCKNFGHTRENCRKLANASQKPNSSNLPAKTEQRKTDQPAKQPTEQMNTFGWIGCMTEQSPASSLTSSSRTSWTIATPLMMPNHTETRTTSSIKILRFQQSVCLQFLPFCQSKVRLHLRPLFRIIVRTSFLHQLPTKQTSPSCAIFPPSCATKFVPSYATALLKPLPNT